MAKNSLSETDLVITQPNSLKIFSLSTGDMGKGSVFSSEVNGNYKIKDADSDSNNSDYRPKSGSLKGTGSRVSFADEEGDGKLVKTYSESEINLEYGVPSHILERSISYSAIEGNCNPYLEAFYREAQFRQGSSEHVMSTAIEEEVNEMGDLKLTDGDSHVTCRSCDEQGAQSSESKNVDAPIEYAHYASPAVVSKLKPPLPNGKSKHKTGTSKQSSWLLRLFESKMFDMSIAISYLFNSKEPGVQTYLGK